MFVQNNSTLQIIPYQQLSITTDSNEEQTLHSKTINNYKRILDSGNFYFKQRKRPQTANPDKKPIRIKEKSLQKMAKNNSQGIHQKQQSTFRRQSNMFRSKTQTTEKESAQQIRKRIKSQMDNYKGEYKEIFDRKQFVNVMMVKDQQKKKGCSYGRVIESVNQLQSHQNGLVHKQYVNLCKKGRSPYGIPINFFIRQFKFLNENNSIVNRQIFKGFKINMDDYGYLVNYEQFQQFYDVFIWRKKSLKVLIRMIVEFFSDNQLQGLSGKCVFDLIDIVQPGNILEIKAPQYYLQQVNKQKKGIKQKLIQKQIVKGQNQPIDLDTLIHVLEQQDIHPYRFYHYLSGNTKY